MQEINKIPLVDILTSRLGEQVVMSGVDYVLLRDKSVVGTLEVEAALQTQSEIFIQSEVTRAISEHKQNGEIYTLNGVGYQVPFMKDDADGMLQVKAAFDMGLTATNIHFSNGTIMPISASEFLAFTMWFVEKRNSFFV